MSTSPGAARSPDIRTGRGWESVSPEVRPLCRSVGEQGVGEHRALRGRLKSGR